MIDRKYHGSGTVLHLFTKSRTQKSQQKETKKGPNKLTTAHLYSLEKYSTLCVIGWVEGVRLSILFFNWSARSSKQFWWPFPISTPKLRKSAALSTNQKAARPITTRGERVRKEKKKRRESETKTTTQRKKCQTRSEIQQ